MIEIQYKINIFEIQFHVKKVAQNDISMAHSLINYLEQELILKTILFLNILPYSEQVFLSLDSIN
jgi:hypothetical protein